MTTTKKLDKQTRYILLYRNFDGEKCRIDFFHPRQLKEIGNIALLPPISLYKLCDGTKISGKCREEGLNKLLTTYKSGVVLVRRISYSVSNIDVLRLITKSSINIADYYMSSRSLRIAFGNEQRIFKCDDTNVVISKDNYIDVGCLYWLLAEHKTKLLSLFGLNIQK